MHHSLFYTAFDLFESSKKAVKGCQWAYCWTACMFGCALACIRAWNYWLHLQFLACIYGVAWCDDLVAFTWGKLRSCVLVTVHIALRYLLQDTLQAFSLLAWGNILSVCLCHLIVLWGCLWWCRLKWRVVWTLTSSHPFLKTCVCPRIALFRLVHSCVLVMHLMLIKSI